MTEWLYANKNHLRYFYRCDHDHMEPITIIKQLSCRSFWIILQLIVMCVKCNYRDDTAEFTTCLLKHIAAKKKEQYQENF